RPAFQIRLVLAATLCANYGIYGPAYELCENRPRVSGSEEYLDSEKYEVRHRDLDQPGGLGGFIERVNTVRRENEALHFDWRLRFTGCDKAPLTCYSTPPPGGRAGVLVLATLAPPPRQSGWVWLDLQALGVGIAETFQVHDLLTDARFLWQGPRNYVELDPQV